MNNLHQTLSTLEQTIASRITAAQTLDDCEAIRIAYFGRKSELTELLRAIASLPKEERPAMGERVNAIKQTQYNRLLEKIAALEAAYDAASVKPCDITLPGTPFSIGHLHPLTQVQDEIISIFTRLGFGIAEGPDIETDYYNFTALNFPVEHPARDAQDTFFLAEQKTSEPFLLRTHTSPVQVRWMLKNTPPFQVIMAGSVYRCDADVTHSPMFHQVEGLALGTDISFADLKGVLHSFAKMMFGNDVRLRFRPSFFPFTEPSAEIDISCVMCGGKGCRVCKQSGWLEILGAGMVHPNVLTNVGYDPENVTGFAFGMGIERIAMLTYSIDDIRLLFENDIRFLRQF